MIEHSFFKKSSEVVRESTVKAFGELESVSKMNPNRFETPFNSIRRILGDKFYEQNRMVSDTIRLIICDNGGFKKPDLKINYEKGAELLKFISMIFQGFIELNNGSVDFSEKFMNDECVKMCIISTSGLVTHNVSLKVLAPISVFDDNGHIIGMKNMLEIGNITEELEKNEKAIQQMESMGNESTMKALYDSRNEFAEKLVKLQGETIDSFFEILDKYNNCDNVEDIYNVSFVFSTSVSDPEGKEEPITSTTLLAYHDVASRNVVTLKKKFNV